MWAVHIGVPMSTAGQSSIAADDATQTRGWLTPGVFGVGGASLCSDTSHELVTSLLPTFVTATLHAGPGVLGAIDGTADALTGLATLAGGPLAKNPERRARLARGGYLGTAVATAAIGVTTAVWQVAILLAIAWVSRGFRSPARDMLLASVLVAAVGVRHAIVLSIIPGVLAALAITIAAREARRAVLSPVGRRTLALNLRELRAAGFARTLTPIALFELGNVATTLLLLRATDLLRDGGRSITAATSVAILLYVGHNAAASGCSLLAGRLADRIGPRPVFAAGIVYVAGYTVFAIGPQPWPLLLVGFLLAGVGIGAAEPAESTIVAQALPETLRGNGSGSWAWCRPSATWAPPSSRACCGRCCRRPSHSVMSQPGCCCQSAPQQCCVSRRTQPEK